MKLLFTLGLIALFSLPALARVYTVNNQIAANEPGKYLYKSITDAHNAATAGDTVYVLGSTLEYSGTVTLTKKLTIIGPGYYLDENTQTQFNRQPAYVSRVILNNGSQGSKIVGLYLYSTYGIEINTNEITIERCFFSQSAEAYINSGSYSVSLQSIVVSKCFFHGTASSTVSCVTQSSYGSVAGLLFSNNICLRPFALKDGSTAQIINNTFIRNSFNVQGSTVSLTNNILLGTDKTKILLPANTAQITYNVSESDIFGTSNGNKAFASSADLFVASGTSDGIYQIKTTGPAYNSGLNGQSMGAFGGVDPYRLSGLPPIPAIYQLTTTGMGLQSGSLEVTVKAKTN